MNTIQYMKTENDNFIVNYVKAIEFDNNIFKKLTRVAFFTNDYKFIRLTDYAKWMELKKDNRQVYTEIKEDESLFEFPEIDKLHFLNEVKAGKEDEHRTFFRWRKQKTHLIPEIVYFKNGVKRLVVKYDIFNNKIIEKNNIRFFKKILPAERRGSFDKWSLYITNCFKYRLKEQIK